MNLKYISTFSGIEAATVAFKPLGWEPVAFSEIDDYCCELLKYHYPNVPNLGDTTQIDWSKYRGKTDIVIGGTPCQSFSYAGKREGLKGESGLMFEYIRCIHEILPKFLIWENVPGALSVEHGNAFGQLLRELEESGYCLSWRVLDAQFFGLPQRRKRIYLVGSLGDTTSAEVLFDPEECGGGVKESKDARKEIANKNGTSLRESCYEIAGNIIGRKLENGGHHTGVRNPEIDGAFTVTATDRHAVICLADLTSKASCNEELCGALKVGGSSPVVLQEDTVRYLTPTECERLQGFSDDYTQIPYKGKPASDSRRYKALGNSMAVPVIRWIGERIERVWTKHL